MSGDEEILSNVAEALAKVRRYLESARGEADRAYWCLSAVAVLVDGALDLVGLAEDYVRRASEHIRKATEGYAGAFRTRWITKLQRIENLIRATRALLDDVFEHADSAMEDLIEDFDLSDVEGGGEEE